MIDEITIQLANGAEEIEKCLERVMHYCRPISDGGIAAFELYDQIQVCEDDELTVSDIWLANGIGAGIQHKHLIDLWKRKEEIEKLLVSVPKQVRLESDDLGPNSFEHLKDLLRRWMSMGGWGVARATKVLHKKRPLLIPPIDRGVMELYSEFRRGECRRRWKFYPWKAKDVVGVIQLIRDDIRNKDNSSHLQTIQETLARKGTELSIVRIFDIILWMHLKNRSRVG